MQRDLLGVEPVCNIGQVTISHTGRRMGLPSLTFPLGGMHDGLSQTVRISV